MSALATDVPAHPAAQQLAYEAMAAGVRVVAQSWGKVDLQKEHRVRREMLKRKGENEVRENGGAGPSEGANKRPRDSSSDP